MRHFKRGFNRTIQEGHMRKIILSLAAVAAIVSAASLVPSRADAMTVGTASAIEAAIAGTSAVQDVAYVCRHRYYSSRRVCSWVPGSRHPRPWRRGWHRR
jgi:hypothetical protein